MRGSLPFLAVGAVLVGSCGDVALDGTWETFPVPGSSIIMKLTQHDTIVTGTGTWSGEACCAGVLTVAGSYHTPRIMLTLTFDKLGGAHYSGTVRDDRHMSGLESFDSGTTDSVTFAKR